MTIEEKVRKELYARLAEGEHLVNNISTIIAQKDAKSFQILNRLQIEIELLLKLYDGQYDDLDDDTFALIDKILLENNTEIRLDV